MKKENILFLIISATLGVVISFSIINISPNLPLYDFWLYTGIFMFIFIGWSLLHVVIHEFGHLIFGLSAGYSFLSFSIYPFSIIKQDNGYTFSKFNKKGIAGQCLMQPSKNTSSLKSAVIYNLGGVMLNLIIVALTILLIKIIQPVGYTLLLMRLFYFAGFVLAITNLLPVVMNGIATDGYNTLMLIVDENSLKALNNGLSIYAQTLSGSLYQELPLDYFYLDDTFNLNNPLLSMILFYRTLYLMEIREYDQAYSLMNNSLQSYPKMLPHYKSLLETELIFLDMLSGKDLLYLENKYESFYEVVKNPNNDLTTLRVKMVYSQFIVKEKSLHEEYSLKYNKLVDSSPYASDKLMAKQFIELINKSYDKLIYSDSTLELL